MTHKIILFISALALFTAAQSMKESPVITQEDYTEEISYEWITTALYECRDKILHIQNALDHTNKNINSYDSDLGCNNRKIYELEEKIKEAQKNIHFLHNSIKNNNLQTDTLEQSVNLITENMQIMTKNIEQLKKNENNYVSKKDIVSLKKTEELPRPTIAYTCYAVKTVPLVTAIGILYIFRKPIQARWNAILKRMWLLLRRQKR